MPAVVDERDSGVVVCDDLGMDALPERHSFRVWRTAEPKMAHRALHLFVLCSATHLSKVANLVTEANKSHRLRALFVRANADTSWLPHMLDRANIRALRNLIVHSTAELPSRVLTAWQNGVADELIADATVAEDMLFVTACDLKRYEVTFTDLPALRRIREQDRSAFEVADDGSYLHWPDQDIHLDLDAIKTVVDPDWNARAMARRLEREQKYGNAIAQLRKEADLTQSGIDGLSERQVRRIEKGEGVSAEALRKLAASHGLTLSTYLEAIGERIAAPNATEK